MKNLFPVAMGIICALVGPALALVSSPAVPGEPVLVLTLPWNGSAEGLIEQSGGFALGPISVPLATLAMPEAPDFIQKLKSGGAWLVLDGRRLAAICGEFI